MLLDQGIIPSCVFDTEEELSKLQLTNISLASPQMSRSSVDENTGHLSFKKLCSIMNLDQNKNCLLTEVSSTSS